MKIKGENVHDEDYIGDDEADFVGGINKFLLWCNSCVPKK